GLVEPEDVMYYYQAFDVMVSFSKTETQGMTVVEALAASIPTVCINDTSFRDIVQNDYNGYLFDTEDEFRKDILKLCYDKELYKEMSINAKNSVYSYSKEVFASKVLKVYHKAINGKKSK
ncbi:MAG: glycosyltransferase, partial [Bacilli bacterium]|nr:glycosyltransferase [Bacilli bacterium]